MVSALFRTASTTAFDKLYRRHAAAVYRYARAVLGNHADAEDVAQQTFLNAYRALAQGTKPRKAENWLFTIAHNEVRRHLRKTIPRQVEVELDDDLAGKATESSGPSVRDVLRALQQLPPNQRSALVMREFEGRSYAEIAEVMELSQSALETLIFRARRTLADALEDGLTCAEAELAVSRRLDGRLSRREARRLKAHMRECGLCTGFEGRQKRQRSLLKGLSVIPVPASLVLFRGESASAIGGMAIGAAATGGSVGVVAKTAAVVAAVSVAGGVGYTAGAGPAPVGKAEQGLVQRAAAKLVPRPAAFRSQTARSTGPARRAAGSPAAERKTHAREPRRAKAFKPKQAKAKPTRAKDSGKAARPPARAEKAARAPKAKRAKAEGLPKQPRSAPEKARSEPKLRRAVEHLRPQPKRARPEKAVPPASGAPAATLPPGREKQSLGPKPEKEK
jgi:RNA polymerase sigma factor (sigma-70 family)